MAIRACTTVDSRTRAAGPRLRGDSTAERGKSSIEFPEAPYSSFLEKARIVKTRKVMMTMKIRASVAK